MKTDFTKFKEFFDEMGVRYSEWYSAESVYLSVTQNHFTFSREGVFLGSEADDIGTFVPRLT